MVLTALKAFAWAHRGIDVQRYSAGQAIDTDDADLIAVATTEGWAAPAGESTEQPVEQESALPTKPARTKRAPQQ